MQSMSAQLSGAAPGQANQLSGSKRVRTDSGSYMIPSPADTAGAAEQANVESRLGGMAAGMQSVEEVSHQLRQMNLDDPVSFMVGQLICLCTGCYPLACSLLEGGLVCFYLH